MFLRLMLMPLRFRYFAAMPAEGRRQISLSRFHFATLLHFHYACSFFAVRLRCQAITPFATRC